MSTPRSASQEPQKAAWDPPREVPDDPNVQKYNENQKFFNDFEMALNALWEHPSVAKLLPMAPQSSRKIA